MSILGIIAGAASSAAIPLYVWQRWHSYMRRRSAPVPPLPEMLGHLVTEGALVGAGLGYALRGAFQGGLRQPAVPAGPPVLCVHGFAMNSTNFWPIRQELDRRGRPSRAIWLGLPGRPVVTYAARVAAALREHDGPIDVIAHSMGGVVLRVALRDDPSLASRIRRIVTIASPHRGTAGARGFVSWLPEPRDLHRRSRLLADLPELTVLAPHAEVTTFGSSVDLVVYPPETTRQDGAVHRDFPFGHMGMLLHPRMAREVADAVK